MGQANYDETNGNRGPLPHDDGDATCKHCGAEGLTWYWSSLHQKRMLHESRPGTLRLQVHRCNPADIAEGEFQDVGE